VEVGPTGLHTPGPVPAWARRRPGPGGGGGRTRSARAPEQAPVLDQLLLPAAGDHHVFRDQPGGQQVDGGRPEAPTGPSTPRYPASARGEAESGHPGAFETVI
jgi:hypothetical protein